MWDVYRVEPPQSPTPSAPALAGPPRRVAADLLARLDRALPDRLAGFYVVGSASMGAFVPGHSDLDFVAIVDGDLTTTELRALRALHLRRWAAALAGDLIAHRRWPLVANGIYLRPGDLTRSPLTVTALAGHVTGRFRAAPRSGYDVNPVTWHVLAHHGVALRGPHPGELSVHADDAELRAYARENLDTYWRRWAMRARSINRRGVPPRRLAAAGVLGAPRLHYTIATGKIATKEAAGRYALDVFESRWRALVQDALALRCGESATAPYRGRPRRQLRDAAAFVREVIASVQSSR